ncbi:MAG: hypothetical protein AAGD32_14700 [Planctomycetota bacterium]
MTTAGTESSAAGTSRYGRTRLWLGISGVGFFVTLATIALAAGVPGQLAALETTGTRRVLMLLGFFGIYAVLHLPFDLLGGYLLPKRHGRSHPPLGVYLFGLLRAVALQGLWMTTALVLMTYLAAWGMQSGTIIGGIGASVAVSAGIVVFLLALRGRMADLYAPLDFAGGRQTETGRDVIEVESDDEGFTGGVTGLFKTQHVLPEHWKQQLGDDGFELAIRRREAAFTTGSFRRGRIVAIVFTLLGVTISALLAGPLLGTAAGTIELALWFTLWSFLGLLTLPTLSRRGVMEVDRAVGADVSENTRKLDQLQDDEPRRPGVVETIFHPIPSVENRLANTTPVTGAWDANRTAVYLSLAGGGLLGRAVHCNSGRPALWAFLPVE